MASEPAGTPSYHDTWRQIYGRDFPDDGPHGWIQWKGTDVCIDLHCECGTHGHYDGDFMYAVQCEDCGRKYAVGSNVKLIELTDPELQAHKFAGDFRKFRDDD